VCRRGLAQSLHTHACTPLAEVSVQGRGEGNPPCLCKGNSEREDRCWECRCKGGCAGVSANVYAFIPGLSLVTNHGIQFNLTDYKTIYEPEIDGVLAEKG